jgi:hypothetical protein
MLDNFAWMARQPDSVSKPGRIGLTHIHGQIGKLVEFGQYLNGDGFTAWEHAFLDLGDGTLIQAEPGREGAQIRPLDIYLDSDVYWCDNIYRTLTYDQAIRIAAFGKQMRGIKYSFLDYDALAMHRLHVPVPGLRSYIASSHHMICSQLCDYAYDLSGVRLFDNRWAGYVTPGDLYVLDKQQALLVDSVACGLCGSFSYCLACRKEYGFDL